jgi:hypothetical protein
VTAFRAGRYRVRSFGAGACARPFFFCRPFAGTLSSIAARFQEAAVRLLRSLVVAFPLAFCACAAPPERAFERVAVMGASMSAGFALDVEVGRLVSMAEVVDRALTVEHAPVAGAADVFFFMRPREVGKELAEKALAARPTLVVGLDFLFWYGYGFFRTDEERLESLEAGLAELARVDCPLVLGDLPDMSESIGKMLRADQVPKPACLARLNARIAEWARARGATLVPLAATLDGLRQGGVVRSGVRTYAGQAARALLQPDRLHPTLEGLACVTVMALDGFARGRGYLDDPRKVAALVK